VASTLKQRSQFTEKVSHKDTQEELKVVG
jgi:hypothetical protein